MTATGSFIWRGIVQEVCGSRKSSVRSSGEARLGTASGGHKMKQFADMILAAEAIKISKEKSHNSPPVF